MMFLRGATESEQDTAPVGIYFQSQICEFIPELHVDLCLKDELFFINTKNDRYGIHYISD